MYSAFGKNLILAFILVLIFGCFGTFVAYKKLNNENGSNIPIISCKKLEYWNFLVIRIPMNYLN